MNLNGYEVYYLFFFCIDPYRFPLFKLSSKILWLKLKKNVIEVCMCAQSCPTLWDPMDCSNQAPLSIEFSRQKYWSELPLPSPGDLLYPGIEPVSPALADSLPLCHLESPYWIIVASQCCVTFFCTETWNSYAYIPSFFEFLPIQVTGASWWLNGKESTCQCRRCQTFGLYRCAEKIAWRRKCILLQYSCLGNPMDRGAWQAAVHRVSKSRTQPGDWACRSPQSSEQSCPCLQSRSSLFIYLIQIRDAACGVIPRCCCCCCC